jgi:hypothetical protein
MDIILPPYSYTENFFSALLNMYVKNAVIIRYITIAGRYTRGEAFAVAIVRVT